MFANLGVPVIDADVIAHALVEPGKPALSRIVDTFGPDIIDDEGRLNRVQLRQIVFANSQQRQQLEAILHPKINDVISAQLLQFQRATYCLLSIPLLVETQQINKVDHVLVVDCSPILQQQRLIKRNGFSQQQIEQILKAQVLQKTRLQFADDVIVNNSNLESLQLSVKALHLQYNRHYADLI
jgi:dephospho-CoA kinase